MIKYIKMTASFNFGNMFSVLAAHFSGAELALMQAKYIGLFQAGWFVESMWSQTLVIHMIRTANKDTPSESASISEDVFLAYRISHIKI